MQRPRIVSTTHRRFYVDYMHEEMRNEKKNPISVAIIVCR